MPVFADAPMTAEQDLAAPPPALWRLVHDDRAIARAPRAARRGELGAAVRATSTEGDHHEVFIPSMRRSQT